MLGPTTIVLLRRASLRNGSWNCNAVREGYVCATRFLDYGKHVKSRIRWLHYYQCVVRAGTNRSCFEVQAGWKFSDAAVDFTALQRISVNVLITIVLHACSRHAVRRPDRGSKPNWRWYRRGHDGTIKQPRKYGRSRVGLANIYLIVEW
jgi:hypothetical protein